MCTFSSAFWCFMYTQNILYQNSMTFILFNFDHLLLSIEFKVASKLLFWFIFPGFILIPLSLQKKKKSGKKWRAAVAAERKRDIQKRNRHTKPNRIRKWQCYYLKEYQTSSDWKPFLSRPIWPQLSWAMTHVRIFICPCGVSYRTFIHHNSSHPVSVHSKTFPLPQSISTTCNRISHTFTIQIHFTHKHNVHSGWSYE